MFPSLCGHCRRMTGKQETIRTRRWLLGDWSFHSDPADFQRMPVEDATPNEFCFKLALMGHTPRTVVDHRLERTVAVPQQDTDNRQLRRFQDSYRQNFTIWRNMRREFRILGYRDFSFCGLVGRKFLNLQPSEFHLSRKPTEMPPRELFFGRFGLQAFAGGER